MALPESNPADPPNHAGADHKSGGGRMRVDKTINVANILTMLAIAFGVVSYGMKTYQEVFAAIAKSQYDILTITERLNRAESGLNQMRIDSVAASNQLRNEIRQDLREMRNSLDLISTRLGPYIQPHSLTRN